MQNISFSDCCYCFLFFFFFLFCSSMGVAFLHKYPPPSGEVIFDGLIYDHHIAAATTGSVCTYLIFYSRLSIVLECLVDPRKQLCAALPCTKNNDFTISNQTKAHPALGLIGSKGNLKRTCRTLIYHDPYICILYDTNNIMNMA